MGTYPTIEGIVERINGFPIYGVGVALGGITSGFDYVAPFRYARLIQPITLAVQALDTLTTTAVVELPLSLEVARSLANALRFMATPEQVAARANSDLTDQEVNAIRYAIQHFTSVLFAELPQADIYFINQKRAFKMGLLVGSAEMVLAKETIYLLAAETVDDIQRAGRCLAYDENTAAGFHALRAVEAVARRYYELVTDTSAINPKTGNPIRLIDIITGLRTKLGKVTTNPDEHPLGLIVGDLNRLRLIYRNPIMHPEMTLNANGATRVFNISTDAISAMIDDTQTGGSHFGALRIWLVSLQPQVPAPNL